MPTCLPPECCPATTATALTQPLWPSLHFEGLLLRHPHWPGTQLQWWPGPRLQCNHDMITTIYLHQCSVTTPLVLLSRLALVALVSVAYGKRRYLDLGLYYASRSSLQPRRRRRPRCPFHTPRPTPALHALPAGPFPLPHVPAIYPLADRRLPHNSHNYRALRTTSLGPNSQLAGLRSRDPQPLARGITLATAMASVPLPPRAGHPYLPVTHMPAATTVRCPVHHNRSYAATQAELAVRVQSRHPNWPGAQLQ